MKVSSYFIFLILGVLSLAAKANQIRLHSHAETSLTARMNSLDVAVKKVDIETFYLEKDEIGLNILKKLIQLKSNPEKSAKLKVRLLLDGWGSETLTTEFACALIDSKIQVKYFNRSASLLNQIRTHRKIWITDQIAIIGGRNLSNENFPFAGNVEPVLSDWDIELYGTIVNEIQQSFDQAWVQAKTIAPNCSQINSSLALAEIAAIKPLLLSSTVKQPTWHKAELTWFADPVGEPVHRPVANQVFSLIQAATKSLELESAFFLPVGIISSELAKAHQRNVNISFYVNGPNFKSWMASYSTCLPLNELLWWNDQGAQVLFTPKQKPTHSKSLLIDNQVLAIGSFNFDSRSINMNAETLLVIKSSPEIFIQFNTEHSRRKQEAVNIVPLNNLFTTYNLTGQQAVDCQSKSSLKPLLKYWF